MTDNYNDDYREVIPEEEKTETNVSETQDNEKNNGNTQVADTAKENSTEKKSEDKKDSSEYEDVCFICRRPESKAGRMFKLPNHICICDDCMHKTMETVSQFDYQGMLNNPNDFNQFNGFPTSRNSRRKRRRKVPNRYSISRTFRHLIRSRPVWMNTW